MLSDFYNRLRDIERDFDEIIPDGMNKQTGYWFSKGMNKLRQFRIDIESDMIAALKLHEEDLDD